jgi:hypothetical protein
MYATGLGYRADKVTGMTGSWRDLGEADSGDRSFLLDDYQEAIGMANLVNGYPLNEVDRDKLDESRDYLVDLKPKLRGISADTITNMVSGNAWIQHLWNGDIVNIRYQVDNPEDFKFQQCREGLPVGSDNFVIPVNAEHPGTALLFIEYMLEPENAAQNVEWIGYPMPPRRFQSASRASAAASGLGRGTGSEAGLSGIDCGSRVAAGQTHTRRRLPRSLAGCKSCTGTTRRRSAGAGCLAGFERRHHPDGGRRSPWLPPGAASFVGRSSVRAVSGPG